MLMVLLQVHLHFSLMIICIIEELECVREQKEWYNLYLTIKLGALLQL